MSHVVFNVSACLCARAQIRTQLSELANHFGQTVRQRLIANTSAHSVSPLTSDYCNHNVKIWLAHFLTSPNKPTPTQGPHTGFFLSFQPCPTVLIRGWSLLSSHRDSSLTCELHCYDFIHRTFRISCSVGESLYLTSENVV